MSKILKVASFGSQGLNSDLPACELPSGFLTNGINFRNASDSIIPYGHYQTVDTLGYSAKFMYSSENYWVLFSGTKAYSYNGLASTDITGPTIVDDGYNWTGTNLAKKLIFASLNNYPMVLNNPTADLVDLPYDVQAASTWRSVNIKAKSIRSFGPFLIAMNVTDAGTNMSDVVQWSHPADVGAVPDSWDYFRDDRLANRVNLGGGGGDIIDGAVLRDSFIIYRSNGISRLSATGDEYVFAISHLSDVASAANVRCITEVKGTHFILTYDDIIANDGNSIQSIIHNKVRRKFMSLFTQSKQKSAFVLRNELSKELWFCIANGSEACDTAFIYNWRDDSWSIIDLPDILHAGFGAIKTSARVWDSWSTSGGGNISWNLSTGIWDQDQLTPFDKSVVGIQEQTNRLLNFHLASADVPIQSMIERTNIPIDGHEVVTSIQRLYPHIDGTGSDESYVMISVGSHDNANGPVRWKPAVRFYPRRDRKVDVRTTGELHAFRIESTSREQWRLSGIDIEYVVTGER